MKQACFVAVHPRSPWRHLRGLRGRHSGRHFGGGGAGRTVRRAPRPSHDETATRTSTTDEHGLRARRQQQRSRRASRARSPRLGLVGHLVPRSVLRRSRRRRPGAPCNFFSCGFMCAFAPCPGEGNLREHGFLRLHARRPHRPGLYGRTAAPVSGGAGGASATTRAARMGGPAGVGGSSSTGNRTTPASPSDASTD